MAQKDARTLIRTTTDVRIKVARILQSVEDKEMSLSEARVHIQGYRTMLDSLKIEIAMAHLQQTVIGPVSLTGKGIPLMQTIPEHKKQ